MGGDAQRWLRSSLGLAAIFIPLGLLISRSALVLHELIGHGVTAALVGADIVAFRLFLFGGGWIRYHRDLSYTTNESLFISLGGITLEAFAALVATLLARRQAQRGHSAFWFRAVALTLGVHAGFYLVGGTYDAFGDGRVLHGQLGSARTPVLAVAAVILLIVAAQMARGLVREIVGMVSMSTPTRTRVVSASVLAAMLAAGVHGGLMLVERSMRADSTYARIMQSSGQRKVEQALAAYVEQKQRQGAPVRPDELEKERLRLAARLAKPSVRPVLGLALAIAILVGAVRGASPLGGPSVDRPSARRLWVTLAGMLVLVAVLDQIGARLTPS